MAADLLVTRVDALYTLDPERGEGALGLIRDGAVAFEGGEVVFVGASADAPPASQVVFARGCVGLPGLVDCHTHALFAGSRAEEFQRRLAGASYTALLEAGGGILSTVRATRDTPDELLAATLRERLEDMRAGGVTTVEVKTGYALDLQHERRCLRLLREARWPVRVVSTYLGAHAVPEEHRGDRAAYVDRIVDEVLPAVAAYADAVDVYCDRGAFTLDEARRVLTAGMSLGLTGRVHAEQVAHTGAAALAAELGAASADHLERIDAEGIRAMAEAGTVAVLLPGAMLYLKDPAPPVEALREAGVPLAVATDFNPGSSPVRDLWTCATLACLTMGLDVEEAVQGITRVAGRALGRPELGWLGAGSAADLALFRPPPGEPADVAPLIQYMGGHRAALVVRDGRVVGGTLTVGMA
ncbi:MAG: imidazolonepropionase [Alphaproteobacteria bacterium]|nr:imidazolonepropionase [Alphaproteobacteria bacterium]